MSDQKDSSNTAKIPKLQNSTRYALWRIYVMEMMRNDGVLGALTEDLPTEGSTSEVVNRFKRMDEKARDQIVLNLGEEQATIITSVLTSDGTTNASWDKLQDNFRKEDT